MFVPPQLGRVCNSPVYSLGPPLRCLSGEIWPPVLCCHRGCVVSPHGRSHRRTHTELVHRFGKPLCCKSACSVEMRTYLQTCVFARVSPAQKERILALLNSYGLTTMMCGDGTNDVGALKVAHVGALYILAFAVCSHHRNRLQESLSSAILYWKRS